MICSSVLKERKFIVRSLHGSRRMRQKWIGALHEEQDMLLRLAMISFEKRNKEQSEAMLASIWFPGKYFARLCNPPLSHEEKTTKSLQRMFGYSTKRE